jgi:hypothetical protein
MKVTITKRVDGSFREGTWMNRHPETGLPYGEDEIILEKVFEVPDAYETESGMLAWDGGHITDHPAIRAWMARS